MLVLLLTALASGLEWRRRQGLYWYDVNTDYRYDFRDAQRVPARLEDGRLRFPDSTDSWQSSFVVLRIRPSLTAQWLEPSIEVVVDGTPACEQFFERGARGLRFVNLCGGSALLTGGAEIRLRPHHLVLDEQDAQLLRFTSPDPDSARILVLAPHPDDAEIAAFGLYAGHDSWIVTLTTGSYAGRKYERLAPEANEREALQARLRVWDSLVVPALGNIDAERVVNLGYFTGTLAEMHAEPRRVVANPVSGSTDVASWRRMNRSNLLVDATATSTWESLVADLALLVDRVRPTIIATPHPALDASQDHAFTTAALLEALDRLGDPELHLFLYTNHHTLTEYFPFGPARSAVTLPPWSDSTMVFGGVYSHALGRQQQLDKLFALEAMHDLRDEPVPVTAGPTPMFLARASRAAQQLWRDPAEEHSYFRRAVRSNELFFVFRSGDRTRIREALPSAGRRAPLDAAAGLPPADAQKANGFE